MKMICEPTRHWYLATPQQGLLFKTIRIEGMRCGLEGCREGVVGSGLACFRMPQPVDLPKRQGL